MKYIIDDNDKNKHEALSKAEVISLLQQVVEEGELPEGELNGLVFSFRNPVDNQDYKIAFCTQAKYNELETQGQLENNCIYYITDDTTIESLESAIEDLQETAEEHNTAIVELQQNATKYITGYRDDTGFHLNLTALIGTTDLSKYVIKVEEREIDAGYWYLKHDNYVLEGGSPDIYRNTFIDENYKITIETYSDGSTPTFTVSERHLYRHDIKITGTYGSPNINYGVYLTLYNNSDVAINFDNIRSYINDDGVIASGYDGGSPIISIAGDSTHLLRFTSTDGTSLSSYTIPNTATFNDTITRIL